MTRRRRTLPRMSAEEAVTFRAMSAENAALIKDAIPCDCEPYRDVFTFNRWRALGYHVLKGEHGIKINVISERTVVDQETGEIRTVKAHAKAVVFCRCQVQATSQPQEA